jgi:hypothetical protein
MAMENARLYQEAQRARRAAENSAADVTHWEVTPRSPAPTPPSSPRS